MPPLPQIAPKSNPKNFKAALSKLGADKAFRAQVEKNPAVLTKEFLSLTELNALRQVALLTGADITQINKVRATGIAATNRAQLAAIDIDVSCCCCCCCGETAVLRVRG